MKNITIKIGGSCLKQPSDIERVVEVVKRYDRPVNVVVSAFHGVTDLLLKAVERKPGLSDGEKLAAVLCNRAYDFLRADSDRIPVIVEKDIRRMTGRLRKLLRTHRGSKSDNTDIERRIVVFGEQLSARVLTAILRMRRVYCGLALPDVIGLFADGQTDDGRVVVSQCRDRISRTLVGNKTYVIPGFYGLTSEGKVSLFGRGGTDYSAAVIAACTDSEWLDLYKDVDGLQTADPRIASGTQPVSEVSAQEASELSLFGAEILHKETMAPLSERLIPVRIFNLYSNTVAFKPGTVIVHRQPSYDRSLKAVTSTTEIGLLSGDLKEQHSDRAIVALIGSSAADQQSTENRVRSALALAGIRPRLLSGSASGLSLYAVVGESERVTAVRALHDEFFAARSQRMCRPA